MGNNSKSSTFHLGITMAGAVSAGAYTAGFMDYVLEALSAWEAAKKENENNPNSNIPDHKVIIDAIGGASAGGMVSMITTLALCAGNIKPVREVSNTKTGNILYDSWVFLDDDNSLYDGSGGGKTTFEKMLTNVDLDANKGAPSLLNSKPIDRIAENVFEQLPANATPNNFPSYISDDLRVLLTVTSLRPLDYKVKFSKIKSKFLDSTPGHRISNHDIVAHFKLKYDEDKDKNKYLPFQPLNSDIVNDLGKKLKSNRDFLINVTKATGAFPIGLAPRYFESDFPMEYVYNSLAERKAFTSQMDIELDIDSKENFQFTAVDGGAINNEPFDEVLRCLVDNHGPEDSVNPKYGTVLIDPFPNFEDEKGAGKPNYEKTSIMDIIGNLIPTVLNQARNKQSDTYGTGLFKLMAFPRKLKLGSRKEVSYPPLATGAIGGFGGFIDIEFRKHDFFLGRDNARNFLRGIMFMEYDKTNPKSLFHGVSDEAIKKFGRNIKQEDGTMKVFMPIIPDVSKLNPDDDPNPSRYTVQDFPKFNKEAFRKLEGPIKNRVKAILKAELNGKMSGWLWGIGKGFIINKISKKMTKWVIETIEKDFSNRGM
ncbi:patatin-like phospholipase family protein [Lutibacter citreus]|uniref:patatin-like phospholipase family protein n=1 Tax=Lutibacter citreus TaxID=2138210 RepID=UPI000DBE74A8|nr:patatin-like phospholipase family protein [Lutibacter citreus]